MNFLYKFNDSPFFRKKQYNSYGYDILVHNVHNNSFISTFKMVRNMYISFNDTCMSQPKYLIQFNSSSHLPIKLSDKHNFTISKAQIAIASWPWPLWSSWRHH